MVGTDFGVGELPIASRQRVLDEIVHGQPTAYEISGAWGTGKSWLLGKLDELLRSSGTEVVKLGISAELGLRAGHDPHPLVEFRQCLTLANEIAGQLRERGDRRLERAVDTLARKASFRPVQVDQSIRATGNAVVYAGGAQTVQFAWADHLTPLAKILTLEVTSAFDRLQRGARVAFLVDDFHRVRSADTASWLLELALRLRNALVVITRQRAVRSAALGPEFHRFTLDVLTEQEVEQYLAYRFGEPPSEQRLSLVNAATGRLPWAVTLVANSVRKVPVEAEHELTRLSARPDLSWRVADLLDVLLDHRDPVLRESLERLSVLRGFDWPLADHMLTPVLPGGTVTADVVAELRHTLLLESAGTPDWPPARAHNLTTYGERLHIPDLVSAAMAERVRERDSPRYANLHRHAADYYWSRIAGFAGDNDPALQFAYWSRFESVAWPALVSEWIYHMAQVPDADHDRVRVLVTRWYLEGFFWYEWLVPHWFCERLLDSCQQLRASGPDLAWLDCLWALHTYFPRGWRHETHPRAWRATTDALLKIRQDAALAEHEPPLEPTDASQTYALATHLLAHALRFQGDRIAMASRYYDETRAWYVGPRNAWGRTYVDLHQAELWLRAAKSNLAQERLPQIEETARHMRDVEMLTFAFRVHADRCWQDNDRPAAMAAYLKAVLHAFAYQVQQIELPNISHFPDAYTRETYEEMSARASARINQLRDEGHHDLIIHVQQACQQLFGPFWEHADLPVGGFFPPPPSDEDLGRQYSDYVRHARWVVEQCNTVLRLRVDDDLVRFMFGGFPAS